LFIVSGITIKKEYSAKKRGCSSRDERDGKRFSKQKLASQREITGQKTSPKLLNSSGDMIIGAIRTGLR
jgi:hypothetical protein